MLEKKLALDWLYNYKSKLSREYDLYLEEARKKSYNAANVIDKVLCFNSKMRVLDDMIYMVKSGNFDE